MIDNTPKEVRDAHAILAALGLSGPMNNERTALTLLALAGLKPGEQWKNIKISRIGITPIMECMSQWYGKKYEPNTRETIRKDSVQPLLNLGLLLKNGDQPNRSINSPNTVYEIAAPFYQLLVLWGTPAFEKKLEAFKALNPELVKLSKKAKEYGEIELYINENHLLKLSIGDHNYLIKSIIEEFLPVFASSSKVVYVGDTEEKYKYFDEDFFIALGIRLDIHGKMPDLIAYEQQRKWLLIIESVTSHGPMDEARLKHFKQVFDNQNAGLVFITAFPDRATFKKFAANIAWETEVWIAEEPQHLIHFNGERFLGPYS